MITDQLTNTIYFSHMLEQVCPDLYRSISTLKAKGYPIEFFQGAKDMWARDYMPIQVAPDKFVAFKYLLTIFLIQSIEIRGQKTLLILLAKS